MSGRWLSVRTVTGKASGDTALLLIDCQRAFTSGAWARAFGGRREVAPIEAAFGRVEDLLTDRVSHLADVPILLSRCPYPGDDFAPEPALLHAFDHVIKPTTNIMLAAGFADWIRAAIAGGVGRLVIGGCTTTSCVRVSAIATHRQFARCGLQVVVDLSLCGARASNHEKTAAEDAELVALYGSATCRERSAVDLAVLQMTASGVQVVDEFDWRHRSVQSLSGPGTSCRSGTAV